MAASPEQGSDKTADYSQSILILTSNAHAEQIGRIQKEVSDYHEMVNAVKGYLAESKVFRPEILGRIDRVYVFQPLEGMVIAEIALLKIGKLAEQYGLKVKFVAPELLVRALAANEKVSRFGIRELERILNDMLADQLLAAQEDGAKEVQIEGYLSGDVQVRPTGLQAGSQEIRG
jgi:ATP-dependent Clp protease ATP-binding subunit ClpA